ncbi:phosphotransferase [Actinoplanes sp. NPDC051851]|uniref:phosphotransferase family protein n=1 Tax=Actinoplanes sp. NPDC051851 TaxID=3154753 RepID=UPI003420E286
MESITKNRQAPDTLRAMITRAYGPDQVPDGDGWAEELGHGWFNVAYRITLRDGTVVVLKIAPPPHVEVMTYERGAMTIELATLRLLTERTGVPVPRVDFADQSHDLCDADYFFMQHIDADNFGIVRDTLSPAERDTYNEALGSANFQINTVSGTAFGPLAAPGDATWRACFTRMIGDVLSDGERRSVDLGHDYAAIRALIAANEDSLDEVTEPRLVEWDLWDGNVMIRDGRIVAIIDHERAFWGDPLMEAGFTAIDLPAFGDSTAFLRGYGHPALTATERRRRRLYTLYLVLIMIIETDYRGHTDTMQYDWARDRLHEVMALFGAGREVR